MNFTVNKSENEEKIWSLPILANEMAKMADYINKNKSSISMVFCQILVAAQKGSYGIELEHFLCQSDEDYLRRCGYIVENKCISWK